MKRAVSLVVALVLLASFVAGCSQRQQATMTLRFGHEQPEDHPYHLSAVKFAELVEQKSKGRIKVEVYPNSQLGSAKAMNEMVATGQLDFDWTWSGVLESYDKNLGVIVLPYLFRDWDHVWKVMDGPIGAELFKGLEEKGIKVIGVGLNGLDNFFSRVPVQHPGDIKGLKVRTQQAPCISEMMSLMGAVVTPMAMGEVYMALQTGAVDGQVQTPTNMVKNKLYEVSKYCVETQFYYMVQCLCMSKKLYDSLSPGDRQIILDAAREAVEWQRQYGEEEEAKCVEFMKSPESGMTWYAADKKEWETAMSVIYDAHPEWADLIARIKEVK
ncbi:MAG TPA: TRAP transporter substrate-binding protein [Firmicutes bacterium]|nr:TRAP transporter substrate-binding protein [Candidatus Fermentithermobacillaceae bacterium]